MSSVHVLVPEGVDDPTRPSGGNVYDRRVCAGLAAAGWSVRERAVPGGWPWPDGAAQEGLGRLVAAVPDDALLLVDGLIGSAAPAVLAPAAERLRLVVLVHLPLGDDPPGHRVVDARGREGTVLGAARAVVTTSSWSRQQLLRRYPLRPDRVHVATPGVDPAPLAPGTPGGVGLLCVAAVTAHKGHDLLVAALAAVADLSWRCVCAGTLDREPQLVAELRRRLVAAGLDDRVELTGPLAGRDLDQAYAGADALVLPSRAETYGMVVSEALAHGLPVLATAVGGVAEALGQTDDGCRPGLLVPPEDARALAAALRGWLTDADRRHRLRTAARQRRTTLSDWSRTTDRIADVLRAAAA